MIDPSSLFSVNNSDVSKLREGVKNWLEARTSSVAYSSISVNTIDHNFAGRVDKVPTHAIHLKVNYSSWLKSWFSFEKNEKVQPLRINEYFIDSGDIEAQSEMQKASNRAVPIILYLSKPSKYRGFDFLECSVLDSGSPGLLFRAYYFPKQTVNKWFIYGSKRYEKIEQIRMIAISLYEVQYGAKKLSKARVDFKKINTDYFKALAGDPEYKPRENELSANTDQAKHRFIYIEKILKKPLRHLFKLLDHPLETTPKIHSKWLFYQTELDEWIGRKVYGIYMDLAGLEDSFNADCKKISSRKEGIAIGVDCQIAKHKTPYWVDFKTAFDKIASTFDEIVKMSVD